MGCKSKKKKNWTVIALANEKQQKFASMFGERDETRKFPIQGGSTVYILFMLDLWHLIWIRIQPLQVLFYGIGLNSDTDANPGKMTQEKLQKSQTA